MKNTLETIAVFGWALNPPTLGHTQILSQVLSETTVDKIILSPDWKRNDKDYGIEDKHKIKIAYLYAENLQNQWFNVEMDNHFLEWKNNEPTTTIAVDQYFREKYWNDIWHIFWSDVAPWMKNWEWNADQYIEKKLQKIFLWRPGYPLNADKHWIENYEYIDNKFIENISSTMVRDMIKNQRKEVAEIIWSNQILDYIQDNNLYT